MTQIATVEKILPGGMAEISVPRKSACGHDCEECAGCGVSGASVRAVARNDARAEVGQPLGFFHGYKTDGILVESSTKNLLGVMPSSIFCRSCCFLSATLRPARSKARDCATPSPSRRF